MERKDSLNQYLQQAIRDNWGHQSLCDIGGLDLSYTDVALRIAKLHLIYDKIGIKPGDKIAIAGKNGALWATSFLSIVTYGAVAVPLLHDFTPDNIMSLLDHCDARLVFVDTAIWKHIDSERIPRLESAVSLADYRILFSRNDGLDEIRNRVNIIFGERYPAEFTKDDIVYYEANPDDIAVINYTSGSTGNPKGVMLSHRAMWSNLQYCIDGLDFLKPGDGAVCMLPLAHMFGLMVDLIHCFTKGCCIHFITRAPTAGVVLSAFNEVRPKLIVTVPLVIEKIIRAKVFPVVRKPVMRIGLLLPFIKTKIHNRIRKSIIDAFGGNMRELIVGGASLSGEVERFLRSIRFPYTVGYGMTECGPLVAYAQWDIQRPRSCGKIVDRMEGRIDSADPVNDPGVLWVKGDNVMQGYYKNPEATAAVFDGEWMSTGDVCTIDRDGYLYIRGRAKTMILGPSGQNIYPEEIEQILNTMPHVAESLVVSRGNKLVALIYPDDEAIKNMTEEQLKSVLDADVKNLNTKVPSHAKIAEYEIMPQEFEKTPKRSIKRFLYK